MDGGNEVLDLEHVEERSWKVSATAAVEDRPQWEIMSSSVRAQGWEVPHKEGLYMPTQIKERDSFLCYSCRKGHGISLWEWCTAASPF